jgi:hypothetical protein
MIMPWKAATKVANYRAVALNRINTCMLESVEHAVSGHVGHYLRASPTYPK